MRILLLFPILLSSLLSHASNLKITASSQPITNIVRLITNHATIDTLTPIGACPHEYILKPSDFKRAQNSDFIIYTNDDFEQFMLPITKRSNAQIINLSRLLNIKPDHNMHIWMSLENVRKATHIIAQNIKLPDTNALAQIDELILYKKSQLADLTSVLLLSDSLEYLFEDMPQVQIEKLYIKPGMTSAKDILILNKQDPKKCIIINDKENVESIASKIKHNIVPVASENWSIQEYKKMIDDIRKNCVAKNGASDRS